MLASALVVLALAFPPAGSAESVADVLAASAADPAADVAHLTARLTRLGPDALPELFAVLAHGPALGRVPTAVEEAALLAALEACPRNALREHVRVRLAGKADTDERRAFLQALEPIATADELVLVRSAAQAASETAALADALTPVIAGMLRRDATALLPVRHWALEAPPDLVRPLVRGIAASTSPRALGALVELLGYRSGLDRLLVPEIGVLLRAAAKPIAPEVVAALLELLASDDPVLVREAALALGETEDSEATGRLVDLLKHEHAGVRAGSAQALERLSGNAFGASPARWRAWYTAESSWLRTEGPELRQRLRTGSFEEVVHALGEVSQRRFGRGELAAEVARVLQHEDARVRRLACLALARLGASASVPALSAVLEDRSQDVRAAARVALRALGAEPPPETDAELEG
jgi:HEAT repeat protein